MSNNQPLPQTLPVLGIAMKLLLGVYLLNKPLNGLIWIAIRMESPATAINSSFNGLGYSDIGLGALIDMYRSKRPTLKSNILKTIEKL